MKWGDLSPYFRGGTDTPDILIALTVASSDSEANSKWCYISLIIISSSIVDTIQVISNSV